MICRLVHVDSDGREIAPQWRSSTNTDAGAFIDVEQGYTRARTTIARYTTELPKFSGGSAGNYNSTLDILEMCFSPSGQRGVTRVWVPAPYDSIFLADNETLDEAAAAPLIAACTAYLKAPNGDTLDVFISGKRRRTIPSR